MGDSLLHKEEKAQSLYMNDTNKAQPGRAKRILGFVGRWIVPCVAVLILMAAMASLFVSLRDTVWCYFSDGVSIKEDALTGRVRMTLFEEPYQAIGAFNVPAAPQNANFTPDEASMIFTGLTGGHTNEVGAMVGLHNDLYLSDWSGTEWRDPVSMAAVNTLSNEITGAVSPDGRHLYVVSDRAGGFGGYDIWIATWDGSVWSGITNAGPSVNTPYDEVDPSFIPGGKRLIFASNRPMNADEIKRRSSTFSTASADFGFDIFSADITETEMLPAATNAPTAEIKGEKASKAAAPGTQAATKPGKNKKPKGARKAVAASTPALPKVLISFGNVGRIDALCSPSDDRHVSYSPHGDYLYFASSRPGGLGGFDVYRSRVVGGVPQFPVNPGLEINSDSDDISPSVRMEGFDLLFSSNRGLPDKRGYMLWATTAREVVPRMDYSRIDSLIASILAAKWWILIGLVAAALLWYLIKHYKDLTDLFHKCLMASAIVHCVLVLLLATWKVAEKLSAEGPGAPKTGNETSININALAREKLTVEISDGSVKLPQSDVTVVAKQTDAYVPLPDFTPQVSSPLKTVVARSTVEAAILENAPSAPREASPTPNKNQPVPPKLEALPPIDTPEIAMVMETRTGAAAMKPGKPTEHFTPVLNVPGISQVKIEYAGTGLVGVASMPGVPGSDILSKNAAAVAGAPRNVEGGESGIGIPNTGGSVVRLSRGGDVSAGPSKLSGPGDIVSLHLASDGNSDILRSAMPGELGVPAGFGNKVSPYMMRKGGRPSVEQVEGLGGSGATEGAVGRALDWFARHQEPDGRWAIQKHGGQAGHDVAASGFAVLCYLGWGIKYNEPGKYQAPAAKAIEWLIKQVKPDGDIRGIGGNMYDQGIASIALAEAYALTRDPVLATTVSNIVGFIERAQNPNTGGWRYMPGDPGDTSVFGWQAMALVSASMAGIAVPKEHMDMAGKWLTSVSGGDRGGLYGYTDKNVSRGMTAEAMFCRQILGMRPDDARMQESAGYLRLQLPTTGAKDLYYWYYATLALYQHGGQEWEDWNRSLKTILPGMQVESGEDAGAWLPAGMAQGDAMGKVVSTALATLSLEVYYRYLPFSFTKGLAPAQAAATAAKTNAAATSPGATTPRKRAR